MRVRRAPTGYRNTIAVLTAAAAAAAAPAAAAQVTIHPTSTQPAAWERFAVRVANNSDTAIVTVRIAVPDAVMILGLEPINGWTSEASRAQDAPQQVEWVGGGLARGEFREFAFLGRLAGDARPNDLVFPVYLTRVDGSTAEWTATGATGLAAPRVRVVGRAQVSARGAMALAGVAIALSIIALAVAVAKRR